MSGLEDTARDDEKRLASEEGRRLLAEAEAALQPTRTFLFFTQPADHGSAAELFERAGNAFKTSGDWRAAGDAFLRASAAFAAAEDSFKESRMLMSAGGALRHVDGRDAVAAMQRAADRMLSNGQFDSAANCEKKMGEILEDPAVGDKAGAMRHYQRAADRFRGENQSSAARACQLRVAHLAADLEQYPAAAEIFEAVAAAAAVDPYARFSVRDYLLKGGLCRIAGGDRVGARRAVDGYAALDASFGGTPECKFLADLLSAIEEDNLESLSDVIASFGRRNVLDDWKTRVLSAISHSLESEAASDLL